MPQFNEADHPRKSNGQFGSGGGGSKKPSAKKEELHPLYAAAQIGAKEKVAGEQNSAAHKSAVQQISKQSGIAPHDVERMLSNGSSEHMTKLYNDLKGSAGKPAFKRGYLTKEQKTSNRLKAGAEAAVHSKMPRDRFYSNLRDEGYSSEEANVAMEHYDRAKAESKKDES